MRTKDEIAEFWEDWRQKLLENSDAFITPKNPKVAEAVEISGASKQDSREKRAEDSWKYVRDNIEYELSKEWKTPEETIRDSIGDCEDVTFLLSSMFAAVGIPETKLIAGNITFPDGRKAQHTWNRVGNYLVDGTGDEESVAAIEYRPELEFTIVSESQCTTCH